MKHIPKYLKNVSHGKNIIYRGHADHEWELKPSIGRHYSGKWSDVTKLELKSLEEFKKSSIPYLKEKPSSDLEWLCLMQHHGCATRLLDFTSNPLVALFFASDPSVDKNGEVIIANYFKVQLKVKNKSLFDVKNNFSYHPRHISERIVGQSGLFVCVSTPNITMTNKKIENINIMQKDKGSIRRELKQLGISFSTLFPGIDGICNDLNDNLILSLKFEEVL